MSIPNTRKREVRPIHPGELLREDVLPDFGLTVSGLARAVCVSRQTVNELLRGVVVAAGTLHLRSVHRRVGWPATAMIA